MTRPNIFASCHDTDGPHRDAARRGRLLALVVLCLMTTAVQAQIVTGPFLPSQPRWSPPGGNSSGVLPDGSLQTLVVDTNGDGLIDSSVDHTHPYPPDLRTDVFAHKYALSPSRDVLYVTGTAVQSCSGQASDTKLFLYRIPSTDGAVLEPLVVGECVRWGVSTAGFFDQGPTASQVFYAIERPDPSTQTQDIFWVDLQTGSAGWSFPSFSQDVVEVRFDPNGFAALVQYDSEQTDNLADYRLIELCADMIGLGYSNTAGALAQVPPPIVDAEVVDAGGVAAIRISQSGSTLLQTELVDCSQLTIDTGACCFSDGSCADGLTQTACESQTNGGTWQGAGTDCASVNCPVPPAPDLSLTGVAPSSVPVQQEYDVDITWSNAGDADATGVNVTFSVPFGVQFVSATGGGAYNGFTRRVTWAVGTLAPNSSGSATVTLVADCTTTSALYTGFFLGSVEIPIVLGNGMSTSFSPAGSGPIQVSIQSVPDAGTPVRNGETITHTFDLVNPTNQTLPTIDLAVSLGVYQQLDTIVNAGTGTASVSNSLLTWSGSLPPSGQTTIVVRMRMSDCRPASVTETVMNNGNDVTFRGSCGVTLATVSPTAPIPLGATQVSVDVQSTNLSRATGTFFVDGRTAPYLARPGDSARFETTITNNYNTPAEGLTATITLGASLLPASDPPFVGTPPTGTTWDPTTQTIVWSGDLPPTSSITIAWDVTIDPNDPCGSGGPNARVTTAACPFLVSSRAQLVLIPLAHAGEHLLTLSPFEGIYRFRPGQDAQAERWFCYNFEIFSGIDEGKDGDLWLAGTPVARLNPERLELELIMGDLFTRLQMSNVNDVAVDQTTGVVYFAGQENTGSPSRSYLRVRAWDRSTDQVTVLFDDSAPPTPTFGPPREMILDDAGRLAVTVNDAVLRIDPATPGSADVYSVPAFGIGGVSSIANDANGDYLLVRASFLSTNPVPLVQMDPATGATTTLEPDLRTLGPTPNQPWFASAFDGVDKLYLMPPNQAFTHEVDVDSPVTLQSFLGGSTSNADLLWYSGASTPTDVPDPPSRAPASLRVASVEPNPFNPRTTIAFEIPRDMRGRLVVHDVRGREIAVLRDGALTAGRHDVVWDGRDANERPVASGVYFVRLVGDAQQDVRKMVLVR